MAETYPVPISNGGQESLDRTVPPRRLGDLGFAFCGTWFQELVKSSGIYSRAKWAVSYIGQVLRASPAESEGILPTADRATPEEVIKEISHYNASQANQL